MLQVQMFSYSNTIDRQVDMQEGINKWLYDNQDVDIIEIKWHHENTRTAMIVYNTKRSNKSSLSKDL